MTDNEIIKALKCCISSLCAECPFKAMICDESVPMAYALDLINRQKAEIEKLNKENENLLIKLCKKVNQESKAIKKLIKAEAIKEFAERLKENSTHFIDIDLKVINCVEVVDIDNLVKEMVGDNE